MNRKKKIILGIVITLLVATLVIVCNVLHRNSIVKDLRVVVTYGAYNEVPQDNLDQAQGIDLARQADTLLRPSTLRAEILGRDHGLLALKVKEVDPRAVAALAMENPFVEQAKASVSVRGDIVLRVTQRTAVARLCLDEEELYLSRDGQLMPLSPDGEADVLVANGLTLGDSLGLDALWQLCAFLHDNPLYGSLFAQASLSPEGDLLLVPQVGEHIVVVGTPENLDRKMADLLVFYRKGLSQVGWNTYQQISLKYNGQIICKKR